LLLVPLLTPFVLMLGSWFAMGALVPWGAIAEQVPVPWLFLPEEEQKPRRPPPRRFFFFPKNFSKNFLTSGRRRPPWGRRKKEVVVRKAGENRTFEMMGVVWAFVFAVALAASRRWKKYKRRLPPAGPGTSEFVYALTNNKVAEAQVSWVEEYGPVFTVGDNSGHCVCVGDPSIAQNFEAPKFDVARTDLLVDAVEEFKEKLLERSHDLEGLVLKLAADAVFLSLFGKKLEYDLDTLVASSRTLRKFFVYRRLHPWHSLLKFFDRSARDKEKQKRRAYAAVEAVLEAEVKEMQEYYDDLTVDDGVVAALIRQNHPMVMEEARNLVLAGFEPTASALMFIFCVIARDPSLAKELADEADDFADEDDVGSLQYHRCPKIQRCIRETLRVYPILPTLGVTCTQSIDFGDYVLPRQTKLVLLNVVLQRHDKGDDIDLDNTDEDPYTFGSCPGHDLVLVLAEPLLRTILPHFTIERRQGSSSSSSSLSKSSSSSSWKRTHREASSSDLLPLASKKVPFVETDMFLWPKAEDLRIEKRQTKKKKKASSYFSFSY